MHDSKVPWELALPLTVEPRLASWNRQGDPDQLRLVAYLDHVYELTAPALAENAGVPFGLGLTVGLPGTIPLADPARRDLDNYLEPVVSRLGPARFTSVAGRKVHGPSSVVVFPTLSEGSPSSPTDGTAGSIRLHPRGSYTRPAWKRDIEAALCDLEVTVLPAGEVHLDIDFTLGPGRNWVSLWKPTIDSLTPLLGTTHPGSFNLSDGRITCLRLRQHVRPGMGHDVIIELSWEQPDL